MMNEERMVRYTADQLAVKRKRGETQTDWERRNTITEEKLEAAIAAGPDRDIPSEVWDNVGSGLPDGTQKA